MSYRDKKKTTPVDPLEVTESLGFQTFRRGLRKPWSKDEDAALVETVKQMYPQDINNLQLDYVDWDKVALKVSPGGLRKSKDCRKRWSNSLDPTLRRGKWTKEEDELLIQAHARHGPLWQKVSMDMKGRTDDQCAKRYLEVLDPSSRDRLRPWGHDEDLQLVRLIQAHGTKWRTIAGEVLGRTSLTCRNRWRKLMTDVARGSSDPAIKREVDAITNKVKQESPEMAAISADRDSSSRSKQLNHSHAGSSGTAGSAHTAGLTAPLGLVEPFRALPPLSLPVPRRPRAATDVEWRYTLAGGPPNLPHKTIFTSENGGVIRNQLLVHELIGYAKTHNLDITVHQHIHHHYAPPAPVPSQSPTLVPFSGDSFGSPPLAPPLGAPPSAPYYGLDPEVSLNRFQHFNYLPPLTEVPKLNSSGSLPATSSKSSGATHHHHHHHHHHHIKEEKEKNRTDALTPLTQAVEMAVAAEAKRPADNQLDRETKKQKPDEEEEEEEMDFFETIRNMDLNQQQKQTLKPVSQHHPLHYSGGTPQPKNGDEEIDEIMESYGLFYNVYTKEGLSIPESGQQEGYDSLVNGMIPFNPS